MGRAVAVRAPSGTALPVLRPASLGPWRTKPGEATITPGRRRLPCGASKTLPDASALRHGETNVTPRVLRRPPLDGRASPSRLSVTSTPVRREAHPRRPEARNRTPYRPSSASPGVPCSRWATSREHQPTARCPPLRRNSGNRVGPGESRGYLETTLPQPWAMSSLAWPSCDSVGNLGVPETFGSLAAAVLSSVPSSSMAAIRAGRA